VLIDFHCHFPYKYGIVCTDSPETPPEMALVPCIGLLPDKWSPQRQEALFQKLKDNPLMQLGEVGLDRRFQDVIPMEAQIKSLKQILEAGISMDRSISLHCVRATGPMLDILASLRYRPYSILWHGFTGSPETASQLDRLKVMVSVGPRARLSLKTLLDANAHMVLETDYEGTDPEEHRGILESRYGEMALETGMSVSEMNTLHRSQPMPTLSKGLGRVRSCGSACAQYRSEANC